MHHGTGEPIELGRDEGVTFASRLNDGIQDVAGSDRGGLFREHPVASGSKELAQLRFKARLLFQSRAAGVSDQHDGTPPFQWNPGRLRSKFEMQLYWSGCGM